MSKMSEMAATIEDLRRCAAAISDAAKWLTEQFSGSEAELEAAATAEPALTLEAVRAVLADKSRAGFTAQIRLCSRSTVLVSCPALILPTTRRCLQMRRD